ncbi:hypothetical protein NLI96_g9737 [Meripilus lineatus]|uniref:FAS1 domain-containing protein n=1 Tax=Meripilus lineatus TaxID=2056292 RepID=A0AAD5YF03_9APHY|nr:hypothetical protein NLI96_g9737 [Physisporinus lineatus]
MYFARISAVVCAALALSVTAGPCANQDQEQQQQHQLLLQSDAVQWRTGFDDRKPPGAPGPPGPPGPRPPLPPHPHPPHEPPNVENKTIFQALSEEPRFSRVFKLVNLTDEITSTLNDSSASVTFFAVPDWALRPPKRPEHDHPPPPGPPPGPPGHEEDDDEESIISNILANPDEIERFTMLESLMLEQSEGDDDHKKKVIKKIIRAVLSYHILPTALPAAELGKNLTHPTSLKLKDGSLDGQALRIRVAVTPKPFRPVITVNMFAKVVLPDIKAKNGFIHVVNHPIGPPPSAFQILFMVSEVFSTFTSALQRVGLTDAVDWRWIPGDDDEKGTLDGTPSLTVFAPTNKAFANLPPKLRFFLFSPFGEWVLKKLLEFHIAPDYILHSSMSSHL